MENLKPIKLIPALKDYIWGGDELKKKFNIKSDMEKVAEAWILSVHKDGNSKLENGEELSEYLKENPNAMGENAQKFDRFPMLIKLIDAHKPLSVQVHPDDAYALSHEGEYGKTEMWYVADCKEGAFLYFGLNQTLTKEEFKKKIADNTITEALNRVPVKKGDTFFISAGTLHAIGEGIVICEIQQNSNTTYRVYDYDRRDKFGNPRELHIEKATETANLKKLEIPADNSRADGLKRFSGYNETFLGGCKYFSAKLLEVDECAELTAKDSFHHITVLENECEITANNVSVTAKSGESVFVPSGLSYKINGKCTVICSYV